MPNASLLPGSGSCPSLLVNSCSTRTRLFCLSNPQPCPGPFDPPPPPPPPGCLAPSALRSPLFPLPRRCATHIQCQQCPPVFRANPSWTWQARIQLLWTRLALVAVLVPQRPQLLQRSQSTTVQVFPRSFFPTFCGVLSCWPYIHSSFSPEPTTGQWQHHSAASIPRFKSCAGLQATSTATYSMVHWRSRYATNIEPNGFRCCPVPMQSVWQLLNLTQAWALFLRRRLQAEQVTSRPRRLPPQQTRLDVRCLDWT